MNDHKLVSIIVPVYNIERYIERCVNSILNQTYKNLEVLLIDDGSTDLSSKICDDLSNKDDRIIVYHKKNGGLSDSRNFGIDRANGDYLSFVDGDDWLEDTFIEKLYRAIEETDCDFVQAQFILAYDNRKETLDVIQDDFKIYNREEAILSFVESGPVGVSVAAWAKLYKKRVFSTVRYPQGKFHEDVFTMCDIVFEAIDNVAVLSEPLYNYYQRMDGISKTINYSRLRDQLESQLYVSDSVDKKASDFKIHADRMLYEIIISVVNSISYDRIDGKEELVKFTQKCCKKISIISLIKYGYKRTLIFYFLIIRFNLRLYLKLINIRRS